MRNYLQELYNCGFAVQMKTKLYNCEQSITRFETDFKIEALVDKRGYVSVVGVIEPHANIIKTIWKEAKKINPNAKCFDNILKRVYNKSMLYLT